MRRFGLAVVRYGIPLAMMIGGIVALEMGDTAAGFGVVLIGSAAIVVMINVLFRLSLVSNKDRERDEQARDEYERRGHWPDE